LDAFARQPLPEDSELWSLPNVIITPRIAGITSQKWPALLPIFRENLRRSSPANRCAISSTQSCSVIDSFGVVDRLVRIK
jgi:phosphoglycerate dehydrogenase-like enzyme